MPAPVFGYSMSRFADQRSREAEAAAGEPLPPGVDPLEALDPELRALVVSTDPVTATDDEVGIGDRLQAGAIGALAGGVLGAIIINVGTTSRRQRLTASAPAMDRAHTLFAAVAGAATGGISGFARGYGPFERAPSRPAEPTPAAVTAASPATHPAFASLHARPQPRG